jgi:hypothetical protein
MNSRIRLSLRIVVAALSLTLYFPSPATAQTSGDHPAPPTIFQTSQSPLVQHSSTFGTAPPAPLGDGREQRQQRWQFRLVRARPVGVARSPIRR